MNTFSNTLLPLSSFVVTLYDEDHNECADQSIVDISNAAAACLKAEEGSLDYEMAYSRYLQLAERWRSEHQKS